MDAPLPVQPARGPGPQEPRAQPLGEHLLLPGACQLVLPERHHRAPPPGRARGSRTASVHDGLQPPRAPRDPGRGGGRPADPRLDRGPAQGRDGSVRRHRRGRHRGLPCPGRRPARAAGGGRAPSGRLSPPIPRPAGSSITPPGRWTTAVRRPPPGPPRSRTGKPGKRAHRRRSPTSGPRPSPSTGPRSASSSGTWPACAPGGQTRRRAKPPGASTTSKSWSRRPTGRAGRT